VLDPGGRYTREREHARGGMGRVLFVRDEHLDRDIALKELLPDSAIDGTTRGVTPPGQSPGRHSAPMVARFLQEARITGKLAHPSIVPVYELGHRDDGSMYYTMKFVRGQSLAEAISRARTLDERLALLPHFADLCQAMAYAHSRGVIHRDIKPSNVMVGEFGETVVIDWGLAKIRGRKDIHEQGMKNTLFAMRGGGAADVAKTEYGQVVGTPAYMSPEQASGSLEEVNERSDVYSLAAVLYELLTGRTPFTARNTAELLAKVREHTPEPVRGKAPKAPAELIAICEKALNRDPRKRYDSAGALSTDIARFLNGAVVSAYHYSLIERFRRC